MIITPAVITAMFTGFKKLFQGGLDSADSQWQKVATLVPSTSKSNTYGWLGKWPRFREWIGDRVFNDLKAHSYTLTNKKFESSAEVDRDDIEDDEIGIYNPLFTEMGTGAAEFPDELVFPLLAAGFATTCYDGQNFFDTDHPVYPNADGTGAAVLTSNMQAGAEQAWFLLDNTRAIKPLIYQLRRKADLKAITDPKSGEGFLRDVYQYGVDLRCQVGFSFWQMAFGSKAVLDEANYAAARTSMMSLKSDGGKPIKVRPKLLVVPPSLEAAALKLVKAEHDASGANNIYYNSAEVLVCPWLTV